MTNFRKDIPQRLMEITSKAMAKKDADRYRSASEMALDLENAMSELFPSSSLMKTSGRYVAI